MNTKKISELNIIENVSEGMNVVIEDNGQTKRFPASKIVTSVNGKTGDVELIPGVQSDWNENDEKSLAFVKNRPFYDGIPVVTEIIPETTFTFSNSDGYMISLLPENFIPTEGETYNVSWDGTEYTCVGSMLESMTCFGNLSIMDNRLEDTGEPFIFIYQVRCMAGTMDTSTAEHTIGIKQPVAQINQIDKKYIPDDAFAQSDWNEQDETNVSFVRNRPLYLGKEASIAVAETTKTIPAGDFYVNYTGECSFNAGTSYHIFGKIYSHPNKFTMGDEFADEIDMIVPCSTDAKLTINFIATDRSGLDSRLGALIVKELYDSTGRSAYNSRFGIGLTKGTGFKYTLKIDLTVTVIKQIDSLLVPDSIARKEYVDSILPSFSEYDYKKTLVINSTGDLEVANYSWNDLSDKPFSKTTSVKEVVSATGTVSSGGGLDISSENPGFASGVEYTVNINGTEETIIAAYSNLSGYVQLTGSNFSIYPTSRGYHLLSSAYSNTEVTISISGPVEEIVTIDTEFIPESIARKEYVDSKLPTYTEDNYKGTFVVNSQGHLEIQRYSWDYLTNKPFGKLNDYAPVAVLNLTTTGKTFTFDSGSMNSLSNNRKYWVVSRSSTGDVGWLASYTEASSYNIYQLIINTSNYPDAIFSKFDFGTNTYTVNGTQNVIPSVVSIYNENEWGTKMMDEAYIPDSIQRVGGDIIISSSTPDSTKKFKITVDDSGAISATEVT